MPDLLHADAVFLLVGLAGMAGLAGVGLRRPTDSAGRTLLLLNLWLLASVLLGLVVPYDARYRMPSRPRSSYSRQDCWPWRTGGRSSPPRLGHTRAPTPGPPCLPPSSACGWRARTRPTSLPCSGASSWRGGRIVFVPDTAAMQYTSEQAQAPFPTSLLAL